MCRAVMLSVLLFCRAGPLWVRGAGVDALDVCGAVPGSHAALLDGLACLENSVRLCFTAFLALCVAIVRSVLSILREITLRG